MVNLEITGYCASIESLDLADMLPHLESLSYWSNDGDGDFALTPGVAQTTMHNFRPKTLPQVRRLQIHRYIIDLQWLLSALSSNIKSCFLTGNRFELNCGIAEFNSIMPNHLGSVSHHGWSLHMGCVYHTPTNDSAKITDAVWFCDTLLKQNRHLLTLEFSLPNLIKESPNDYKFVSSFKKRAHIE
jgi:hypothetical protein